MSADPVFLTVDDVLALHIDQIREFGGSEGIRDQGGLESAVARPGRRMAGSTCIRACSKWRRPMRSTSLRIIFLDGNKRTALNAAIVFLGLNGFDVVDDEGRLYDATMGIARGQLGKGQMASLLEQLSEPWRDDV